MKNLTFIKANNDWLFAKIFCKNATDEASPKIIKMRML
jgi:hypothetical protein